MRTGCPIRLVPDGCYRGTVGHDRERPASPVMPNAPFRPSRQCPFLSFPQMPFLSFPPQKETQHFLAIIPRMTFSLRMTFCRGLTRGEGGLLFEGKGRASVSMMGAVRV